MMAAAHNTESTTSDISRLDRLLRRFSTSAKDLASERGTLPDSPDARLQALLSEIDETVLPRRVNLRAGEQSVARLTISNRRLVAVDLSGSSPQQAQLQSTADQFAEGLLGIAGTEGPLSVTVDHRPAQSDSLEATCSVSALEAVLGLDTSQSTFERFAQVITPLAIAQSSWPPGPACPGFSGASDWRDLLETYAQEFRNRGKGGRSNAHFEPDETEGVVIPLTDDRILVIAGVAEAGLAAVLPRTTGLEAIAVWQIAAASHKS